MLHSEPWSCCETGRVTACSRASGNVASDDATSTDHGIITYGYTRQNDRAAANPYVPTDLDRAPKLGTRSANRWITGMVCRVYLDRWAYLRPRSDSHSNDIENHATKIEEDVSPDPDIVAVVAIKWWSDYRPVPGPRQ
jgi:hypothetical protein